MNAKDFFEDNLNRHIDRTADPAGYNLNWGLLTMAKQLNDIESRQRSMEQELHRVKQIVQQLR